jgi:hypothetical protein
MSAVPIELPACRYCERRPVGGNTLGLCDVCHRARCVRRLYVPNPDRPSWWEAHLDRLAERARRRLPLFPD